MAATNNRTVSPAGAPTPVGDCSVAGEEDPGASLDCVTARSKEETLKFGRAVPRCEGEGGCNSGEVDTAPGGPAEGERVKLTDAELAQLQLRVIALEGLVTALLAHAPEKTAGLVRALAANIAPRPGSTQHHLTVRATAQMVHLLERANVSKVDFPSSDEDL